MIIFLGGIGDGGEVRYFGGEGTVMIAIVQQELESRLSEIFIFTSVNELVK